VTLNCVLFISSFVKATSRWMHMALDSSVLSCFPVEVTFPVCGTVNRQNCHVWQTESPQDITEHERDSPMINM